MKKNILIISLSLFVASLVNSQNEESFIEDQNPNYKKSREKYEKLILQDTLSVNYLKLQGMTLQETYEAIDFLEQKRKLRLKRKYYRSQRKLWRHEERMERAKHSPHYVSTPGYYDNYYNYPTTYYENINGLNTASLLLTLGVLSFF